MHVVIIDDDADTHDFLTLYLKSEGFDVYSAYTAAAGMQLTQKHDPDLVILDIQLPHMDGWEACQRIRSFSGVPIVMISAVAREDEDIVRGLNIGADDYIVKPLRPDVLKARMKALLRRSANVDWRESRQIYVDPHLTIDLYRQQVHVEGRRIPLSFLEYGLLELLVRNAGHAVPTLEITEELWSEVVGDNYVRYVRIYIKRLRDNLEPDPSNPHYIVTEHGLGYRFVPQV